MKKKARKVTKPSLLQNNEEIIIPKVIIMLIQDMTNLNLDMKLYHLNPNQDMRQYQR